MQAFFRVCRREPGTDCSTIDAATARELHEAARDVGIEFMDTPVSGGVAAHKPEPGVYVRWHC